jgi:hypothetical protein
MSIVLKMSDRVNVKIGKVSFSLAPMNYLQKQSIAACTRMVGGIEELDLLSSQALYLKLSVKEVKGLMGYDKKPYELEFEGDTLTDDCVSEIMNIEQSQTLAVAAWSFLNGIDKDADIDGAKIKVVSQGN